MTVCSLSLCPTKATIFHVMLTDAKCLRAPHSDNVISAYTAVRLSVILAYCIETVEP